MKVKVRQISESEFTVQGHGVHTAYKELTWALQKNPDAVVMVNQRGHADITHIHTIGVYSLFYLLFSSGKKVVSAHVIPVSFIGSLVAAKYWLFLANIYVRWFYNRADLVLAVSDETKRQLIKLGVTKPIEVFYNIIDTSRYQTSATIKKTAREKLGIEPTEWVIICVGQAQPRKRVDDFIATAKAMPDCRFIWVGGMPFGQIAAEHGHINQLIETAPSNVTFTGVIPFEQVAQYYFAADVFFLPSEQETFGLVVVEAAAAGLPIVLRDIPDYTETFKAEALLVKGDEFVATLTQLRSDTALYQQMQHKSQKIAQRYDSQVGAVRAVDLYRQLLNRQDTSKLSKSS